MLVEIDFSRPTAYRRYATFPKTNYCVPTARQICGNNHCFYQHFVPNGTFQISCVCPEKMASHLFYMQKVYTFAKSIIKSKTMRTISLKLDECIFEETENILATTPKARNRYINEALNYYNRVQKRIMLENTLRKESKAVAVSSMEVLKEFETNDW